MFENFPWWILSIGGFILALHILLTGFPPRKKETLITTYTWECDYCTYKLYGTSVEIVDEAADKHFKKWHEGLNV